MVEISNAKDLGGLSLTAEFTAVNTIVFFLEGEVIHTWVEDCLATDEDVWYAFEIQGKMYDVNYFMDSTDHKHKVSFYGLFQQEGEDTAETNTDSWHSIMVDASKNKNKLPLVLKVGAQLTALLPNGTYTVTIEGERDKDSVWVINDGKQTWIHKNSIYGHLGFDVNPYVNFNGSTYVSGYFYAYDEDLESAYKFRSDKLSAIALYIERNIGELLKTLNDINSVTGHVKVAITKFSTDKINVSMKDPQGRDLHVSIDSNAESGIDISYADPNSKVPCPWSREDSFGVWVDTNSMKPEDDGEVVPRVHLYASQYNEDDEGCPVSFSFVRDSTKRTRFVTRIADDGQHYAS